MVLLFGKLDRLSLLGWVCFVMVLSPVQAQVDQKGNKIEGLMVCRAKYANEQGYLSFEKSFSGIWNGQNLIYQDEQMLSYINGDIISLNYNGNYILEKFTLKNEKHKVDVILDGDKAVPNYLILYAHNLGEISPNTVAVIVDDGVTQQRFILNADMKTSDVIYFKQI